MEAEEITKPNTINKMKKAYRHGDVIITEATKIPASAKRIKEDVLLDGEVTGHAHRVIGEFELYTDEDRKFLNAINCSVVHEEHHKIDLPTGIFEITRQREYEPEGWRYVND